MCIEVIAWNVIVVFFETQCSIEISTLEKQSQTADQPDQYASNKSYEQ